MQNKLLTSLDLIKKSWEIYKNNFNDYLQPILIMLITYGIYMFAFEIEFPGQNYVIALLLLVQILVSIWISIVFIQISAKLYAKKEIDLNKIYKDSFLRSAKYFWISFLFALIILGGFVLLIIPAIIFSVWFAFVEVSVSIDDRKKGVFKLFSESKNLSKNKWWAVLFRLIIPQIFFALIMFAIIILILLITTRAQVTIEDLNNIIWYNLLFFIISIIFQPLLILPKVLLYDNLKTVTK